MITPLSKVIDLTFNLNETSKTLLASAATDKQFNTADTDAWFEFGFTDANIQSGTYNLTLINLADESKFEHEGIAFASNPFYYKLDSGADMLTNEIKHAGAWIGQLVVTLSNGDSATQKFVFEIDSHILDGEVASVSMLEGYTVLESQMQNAIALLDQNNTNYAPRLLSAEQQLEHLDNTKAELSDVQQASLAYKESYATLSALQTAYPTGDGYNHTVLADGLIYTYANASWTSTGLQANGTGIADKSIGLDKIDFATNGKNLFNPDAVITGKALTASTGAETTSAAATISEYIPASENTQYSIANGIGSGSLGHCFYDANKVYISGVVSGTAGLQTITSPVGTAFLRVSTLTSDLNSQQVEKGLATLFEPWQRWFSEKNMPATKPEKTSFFQVGKNKFDKAKIIDGFYVNQTTGILTAGATHKVTDYIPIVESLSYIGNQLMQRYAFYTVNLQFISGGLGATGVAITAPVNAKYLRVSCDSWTIDTLQIEEGTVSTTYEDWKLVIPSNLVEPETPPIVGDEGKTYKMCGANIRTPLSVGGSFAFHNDVGHEPMGMASLTIVDGDLRVAMNFISKKVIYMHVEPHVSMLIEGYRIATTGGLQIHAVRFYKDGLKVNAEDVVINGGSFWFSGMFLV